MSVLGWVKIEEESAMINCFINSIKKTKLTKEEREH